MKRGIIVFTFLLAFNLVLAVDINKTVPPNAEPASQIPVELDITTDTGSEITIEEKIPENTTIVGWNIEGSEEEKEKINYRVEGNKHIWTFTASTENPSLEYNLQMPDTATGAYNLTTEYFFPETRGSIDSKVVVADMAPELMPEELRPVIQKETSEIEEEEEKSISKIILWVIPILILIIIIVFVFYRKRKEEYIY